MAWKAENAHLQKCDRGALRAKRHGAINPCSNGIEDADEATGERKKTAHSSD